MKKRLAAFCLTLALLTSAAFAAGTSLPTKNDFASAGFTDLSSSDWYYSSMKLCYETGLMTGTDSGAEPLKTLTLSEAAVLAARMAAALREDTIPAPTASQAWWEPYNAYLTENSLSSGISAAESSSTATRQQFLKLLYGAAKPLFSAVNSISTLPDTSDSQILEFYNSGILTGKDAYGTFDGDGTLSRAEAAAMLARVIDPSLRQTFTPQAKPAQEETDYQTQVNTTAALFVNGDPITLQSYVATLNSLADQFCSYYGLENSKLYSGTYGSVDDFTSLFAETAEEQLLEEYFAEKLAEVYGCAVSNLALKMTPSATTQELKSFAASYPYYRASHILILSENRTDAEAKALAQSLIDQITANPSVSVFNALISAYGEDPGMQSYPSGYLFTDGEMVSEFENAVKALGEYEYTLNPVKTSYGYHVIMRLPAETHPDILTTYQNYVLSETLKSNISSATITKNQRMLDQIDIPASYADYLSKNAG